MKDTAEIKQGGKPAIKKEQSENKEAFSEMKTSVKIKCSLEQ